MTLSIEEYYNEFASKLLRDFISGNPRTESAISFACAHLRKRKPQRMLDIGCGLGWSTYEFSKTIPQADVVGVDLSPRLIELAAAMFGNGVKTNYLLQDISDPGLSNRWKHKYDACVMLDVYEHIQLERRSYFHGCLNSLLTDDAIVVLSCPTPLHQRYLREAYPDKLQPVDEDVSFKDLVVLADAVGGTIFHMEHKSIWATNDYFHAVISRRVSRGPRFDDSTPHRLLSKAERLGYLNRASEVVGKDEIQSIKRSSPCAVRRMIGRLRVK